MAGDTATVETLVAEVRVLTVGNRQITQSVAKQLDYAEPWEMQPFGRVKTSEGLRAIGKGAWGELVLAKHHDCDIHLPNNRVLGYDGRARAVTTGTQPYMCHWVEYKDAVRFEPVGSLIDRCRCCADCQPGDLVSVRYWNRSYMKWSQDEQPTYTAQTDDVTSIHRHEGTGNRFGKKWLSSLPLIVLAGLR